MKSFLQALPSPNKLLLAVAADLSVDNFLACCRALGIVHKILIQPLWFTLNDTKTNLHNMNFIYEEILIFLQRFAENPYPLMTSQGAKVLYF